MLGVKNKVILCTTINQTIAPQDVEHHQSDHLPNLQAVEDIFVNQAAL